jgi:hypothetical protein
MGKDIGAEMKFSFRYIAITGLFLLVILNVSFSQLQNGSSIGGLAGAPMRMGFGSRGIAMGNAMTAVINGDIQAYYNPAALPFESVPTAVAAYSVLSLDRRLNYLSYTQSLKPNAGISLSIINAGVGDIDGRDEDGVHTQTYSTSENSFMFSFGLQPVPKFSFGITMKVLYYNFVENIRSTTAAIDIGAIYLLSQEITLGAAVQDINAKYKWDTSPLYGTNNGNSTIDRFPLRKRIGISWVPANYSLILSGELEAIGSADFFRIGTEIEIYDGIHLLGGIDQIALNTDLPAKPSLGISVQTKLSTWTPAFQYAYVFEPYSPSGIHILSFSLRF